MQEYGVTTCGTSFYSTNSMKQEISASSALICCGIEYNIVETTTSVSWGPVVIS